MPVVSPSEWSQFLQKHPHSHLLQTGEWGELKSTFGWQALRLINGEGGAQILFRKLSLGLTVGYVPKGPVANNPAVNQQFWLELDAICKNQHAIFCKLEPDAWDTVHWTLNIGRWSLSRYNIQPPRTIIVDILGTESEILARMKQKTRYNIRLAEKKGVTVRTCDDLALFHKMMLITGERDRFGAHSLEYYRRAYELFHPAGMCELLLAEYDRRPLAALMVFARGRRAWYVYGASTDDERSRMPAYLLQWEAMRWARSRGCEEYDLWGVPDENEETLEANFESRNDELWGVYRFKRGFGGELKRAMQACDRVYNPLLYKLYLWRMAGRERG